MKSFSFLITGVLAVSLLASCSEDISEFESFDGGKLTIKIDNDNLDVTTRASYSGFTTSFQSGDQIGLYVTNGSQQVLGNVCYTYNGSSWTTTSDVEYNSNYTYYAYYPYNSSPYAADFSQSAIDDKFSLFIRDDNNKFHYADQSASTGGKTNFTLSDLMIAQGTDTGSSNTVSFTMLHKKGLAVFEGNDVLTTTFTGNIPYTHSSKRYFLMKPSTSTSFTDEIDTYSLSASSGKYVTHNIDDSYSTFTLSVTGPEAYTYSGGSKSYSVTSYKSNSAGTKSKAAAWTATYSTDGGSSYSSTKPSWLTTFTASGDGSTSATEYTATISAQTGASVTASATSILRSETPLGSSSDYYDLSTNGGTAPMTTANCYMVHAPGYYKLPLVYGNAIKDGSTNRNAFFPNSNGLRRFVNHNDEAISDPWIKNNGVTVISASYLWQDVNSLTTNYTIDGDYLKFEVPAGSIAEGNAVIAAWRDTGSGSEIVWSWHIWVTPEDYSNLSHVEDRYVDTYVTGVNLGWVNAGNITKSTYDGRSCIVKISQTGSGGQERTFTVTQQSGRVIISAHDGNSPYYQWGRKDPFVPSVDIVEQSNTDKTVYTNNGVPDSGCDAIEDNLTTIGTTIKNPTTLYKTSYIEVIDDTPSNLWNALSGGYSTDYYYDYKTTKTIYDPCPPGFCVPNAMLWQYLQNVQQLFYSDSSSMEFNWGYLPATGYRFFDNNHGTYNIFLADVGVEGNYWSSSFYQTRSGCYSFNFNSTGSSMITKEPAYGLSIRPVAED